MDIDKSIGILNNLIEINNDRIEGYETASKETDENELKVLFTGFITNSERWKKELVKQVIELGGTPEEGTRTTGKFFRAWMDVKAALTNKDRKAILNSCEYGEDAAVKAYAQALTDSAALSSIVYELIETQQILIKQDHNKVNRLIGDLQIHKDYI